MIIPLSDTEEATQDIYGCDADVFAATYEPSPSLRPNRYLKREKVRAYQPGGPFEVDTVLSDGHVEVAGARTESDDAWIVRAPGGETYIVENVEFGRTYVKVPERKKSYRVKDRNEHWADDGTPKRILALDGGGVRGILTLGFLERIEQILRARHGGSEEFRLSHYFDLIAGTSTGAIIAACLARGMPVGDVRCKYENLAGSVFKRSLFRPGLLRARYGAGELRRILEETFKGNTLGSLSLQTGLLVAAKRLDTGSTWPMNNNPRNRFFTARPNDPFLSNEDYPLPAVIRASTAAPLYFAPEFIEISQDGDRPHGMFVDGGVSPHNNPALLALQLATVKGFGAGWPLDPDKLLLVSVGTGSARPGTSGSCFALPHAAKSLLSLMDDCAESVEIILQWLSNSPTARHIDASMGELGPDLLAERPLLQYLRYNVRLDRQWLGTNLHRHMTDRDVQELHKMDEPKNMLLLSEIGSQAANVQVRDEHFPPGFDLWE